MPGKCCGCQKVVLDKERSRCDGCSQEAHFVCLVGPGRGEMQCGACRRASSASTSYVVVLATALVNMHSICGETLKFRALIDPGVHGVFCERTADDPIEVVPVGELGNSSVGRGKRNAKQGLH